MTDIHQVFCKNLTLIRKENGLTQEAFAERLNASIKYAQQLEYGYKTGTQWPSPGKIKQLAKILKCDTVDFFRPI